jgi:hypothetical protein
MKKPECECFGDAKYGADVKTAVIASECSMTFFEEMNAMGMCGLSAEYVLVTTLATIARDVCDNIGGGRTGFKEFCGRVGALMLEREEELEVISAQCESEQAVKQ